LYAGIEEADLEGVVGNGTSGTNQLAVRTIAVVPERANVAYQM
jgi:hypothetical protein